jgi:hypothetical protein
MPNELEYYTIVELDMSDVIRRGLDSIIEPSVRMLMEKMRQDFCKELSGRLKENNRFLFTLRVQVPGI